ncbi:hypothetical protein LCGC14_2468840 [marine sediment metagenome]|uniref:Uncharacterized protein n=1 Tax=marine sediment metagenome TaxID=412755 RepID=A0A0F9E507_9ZZZZ
MTMTRLADEESRAELILEEAQEQYRDVLEDLRALRLCLREQSELSEAEVKRVLTEHRRITLTVFEERKRLEDLRKRQKGIVHDYALDFDALRDEIGGRLDRLRAAKHAEGVS